MALYFSTFLPIVFPYNRVSLMGSRKPFTFHSELVLAVGVLSVTPSVATAGAC